MTLNDKSAHYMIVSAYSSMQDDYTNKVLSSKLEDALYRKEYELMKLEQGNKSVSYLAFKKDAENNNELRYDAIELMDSYYQDSIIVKYHGENKVKRIMKDGSERTLGLSNYNGDIHNSYFKEGISFSFVEQEEYFTPKKREDFEEGMIVEIKNNNNKWISREVIDPEEEWNKMYKLLVKYERVRCLIKND